MWVMVFMSRATVGCVRGPDTLQEVLATQTLCSCGTECFPSPAQPNPASPTHPPSPHPSAALQEETALDAVQLCDRVMAAGISMEAGLAPLYAAAVLLLCCRQCE